MSRRLATTLPAVLLALLALFQPGSPALAKPANIVFIVADDLDQEVFGHAQRIQTLLTAQGARFSQHFVSLSLCCPSRVAILRGQYAHNTGIFDNQAPNGGFAKVYREGLEESTVPVWLQAAGYRTALFGKYLNGYPDRHSGIAYIPPGWSHWVSPNGGDPYNEYDYALNENGKTVAYGHGDDDYLVDVLARKAARFIREQAAAYPEQPFLLYVAPYVPHGPATPPARYAGDFPDVTAPRTAAFDEADVSDKPAWVRAKPRLSADDLAKLDALYRKRRQSMEAVEDLVRELLDSLREAGELERTYVFFTSDNGFHQGQHRLMSGKNTGFEEDLRVPLVVRGPGIAAGRVIDALTANVDFAPTFAAIAGITPPDFVDGRSLLPLLQGTAPATWRRVLLLEHRGPSLTPPSANGLAEPPDAYDDSSRRGGGAPVFAGLRGGERGLAGLGPLSYLEYDTGERELYDLAADPAQLRNVFAEAGAADRHALHSVLASLRRVSGAALRRAEEVPAQFAKIRRPASGRRWASR